MSAYLKNCLAHRFKQGSGLLYICFAPADEKEELSLLCRAPGTHDRGVEEPYFTLRCLMCHELRKRRINRTTVDPQGVLFKVSQKAAFFVQSHFLNHLRLGEHCDHDLHLFGHIRRRLRPNSTF